MSAAEPQQPAPTGEQRPPVALDRVLIPADMLPDGSLAEAAILVVAYMNAEGESQYVLRTGGDRSMATYLGLVQGAQHSIMHKWAPEDWEPDEDE